VPPNAALGVYDVALVRPAGKATPALRLASGSLRVEAFRVPLVDARLGGPSGVLVAPGELSFTAQLSAMAGGPMPGAPLQLSALLRPVSPQFAGYDDFSFEPPTDLNGPPREEAEGSDSSGDGSTLVANKLAASTDAKGAASITVKPLPALKGPAELQAELSFADPSGETQTVSQRLRLWPASVVVGLRVPQWAADRGAARFTAVVLSTDGKPLVARAVQVQGRTVQTFSTRQRIVGGFYAYQNRREAKDLGVLCSGKTDAQGRLACDVKLDISGELELIASAKDDAGRSSQALACSSRLREARWRALVCAKRCAKRLATPAACSTGMPEMASAVCALMSLRSARLCATAGADRRWYSHTMATTAGTKVATISISRQSSTAMVTSSAVSVIRLSSITNNSCTYSVFTASVSLVTRLTNCPVMARSKNAIGRRITWPYTCSRMRCTLRMATPARPKSCQ
jgi:hypothetical protein